MRRKTGWVVITVVAGVAAAALAAAAVPVAKVGRPAPAFTLKDQDGKTVTLVSLRGRIVVLEWMNPDCPFWKRHAAAGTMRNLAETYAPKGVAWYAVNSTAHLPIERDAWAREAFYLPYPVLNDRRGRVGRVYGAKTTPHLFVIDARGRLAYAGAIDDDPAGEHDVRLRTLKGGPGVLNYVRQALDELLAGKPVSVPETKPYGCSVKYADQDLPRR
jgi:peroxiredoxin